MSPAQIIDSNPARKRESDRSHKLRLVAVACDHVTNATYDHCLAVIQRYAAGKKGDVEDMFSNLLIELHADKLKALKALSQNV